MSERVFVIKNPSDYCNSLLKIFNSIDCCKEYRNNGEYIYYRGQNIEMNMRRIIISSGFELFINRCITDKDFSFDVKQSYNALEIITSVDNEMEEIEGNVRFSYFNWKNLDDKERIQTVTIKKSNRTYMTLFIDNTQLSQFLNIGELKKLNHNDWRVLSEQDSLLVFDIMKQLIRNDWDKETQKLFFHAKSLEYLSIIAKIINNNVLWQNNDNIDRGDRDILEEIQNIIKTQYYRNLTIEKISKQVYKNSSWIKTKYKSAYGTTIHQEVINCRMNKALQYLRVDKLSVEETTRKIGYENTSHFINTFKRYFGITPGKFIKMERSQFPEK